MCGRRASGRGRQARGWALASAYGALARRLDQIGLNSATLLFADSLIADVGLGRWSLRYVLRCISVLGVAETVGGESIPWRTFGVRNVHGSSELSLSEVDVGLPTGERVWLPVVRLPRSVGVALLDGRGGVLLVQRYRFVDERWGWELPGGQVDEDEEDSDAAARELEDQTGYRAGRLEPLITFQPAAEVVDGERVVFVGSEPVLVGEPVSLDVSERAEWVPLASVPGLIASGQVWNGASVVGLLSVIGRDR